MSLRELWNEFAAARERQRQGIQRDLALAWHIEALHRQKTLPALRDLLKIGRPRQTVAEQRVMLQMLSESIGSPLRRRKAKAK